MKGQPPPPQIGCAVFPQSPPLYSYNTIPYFDYNIIYDVSSPIDCSNLADNNLYGDIPVQLLQVAQHEYVGY